MRVLPLLLVLLVASGCNVTGRVEAEIEAALPRTLGPAARYEATVQGLDLGDRSAEAVSIVGERVAREGAPVLDRLDVTLRGVALDRKTRTLSRADDARATLRLLPADLAAYLNARPDISSATVAFAAPDRATVRVEGVFEGVRIPVGAEVQGRLVAVGGRVRLEVSSVRAGRLPLGGAVAQALERRLNPVLDLTEEDLSLRVTAVRVEGPALVLEATGDLVGTRLR